MVLVVVATRVNSTIDSIDSTVSLQDSASSMIDNLDVLLNTSTQIASTVHELGIKGLDASVFSKPYLTKMLNSSTLLVEDMHQVARNPTFKIG